MGNLLRRTGDLTGAVQQYRWALALRPTFTEAHTNLGSLYADQGKFDEARASLEEALRIDPDDGPSKKLAERCREYVAHPPPSFDGVVNLEK